MTSFLITEPTSTTGITGTESRVELAGGANLWGVWTVDESNEVNVSARVGWGQPSSVTGDGEVEALEGGRALFLETLDIGALLVGGEAVVETEENANVDILISDGTLRANIPVTSDRARIFGGSLTGPGGYIVSDQLTWEGGELATNTTTARLRLGTGLSSTGALRVRRERRWPVGVHAGTSTGALRVIRKPPSIVTTSPVRTAFGCGSPTDSVSSPNER